MKIIAAYFERSSKFRKYLKVFRASIKKTMPEAKTTIVEMITPNNIDHKRDTAYAFIAAAEYALQSKEMLAVCDIDLMFIKSILDIEDYKFDIAVTTRDKMKYNTGLWFYRPSKNAKIFLKRWIKNTRFLMDNFCEYEEFSWKHGGIDQASLAMTIEQIGDIITILELPCTEWNATQSEWKHITPETRVIHVKSKLALAAFGRIDVPEDHEYMIPLIEQWKDCLK